MNNIVLFGAGEMGQAAARYYQLRGDNVVYFIDNDQNKWGKSVAGIQVISLAQYEQMEEEYKLIVSCNIQNRKEIFQQLTSRGIREFEACEEYLNRDRMISYSQPCDREDIILFHVLEAVDPIFYIDVGSNDPVQDSVTKLLYDVKEARGINIEPQKDLYQRTVRERRRDINLCVGIGQKQETATLYLNGALSTLLEENALVTSKAEQIEVVTLDHVCRKYLKQGQEITFLKVDVEGAERDVLLGADFQLYRPWIIVMESTLPGTMTPCYDAWEYILLSNQYHFAYSYGVNRYYVADEKSELDKKFACINDIYVKYRVLSVCYKDL